MTEKKVIEKRYAKELKVFFRNRLGVIGLLGVAFLLLVALFAPLLAENVTGYGSYQDKLLPPSAAHPMGTDDMALDLYAQVVWGTRASIKVGAISMLVAALIGVPIGLVSGFYGKWVDTLGMGITDVFLTIPMLPLMIIATAMLDRTSINTVAIIIGLFAWPSIARITRSSTMKCCGLQYIEAARCLGIRNRTIVFRHVLVNVSTPVFVGLTVVMATSIVAESAISFLGLGDPLVHSWGKILHNAYISGAFSSAWWFSMFPSLGIMLFVISFNFLSIGIRDALNPKISRE
ncbi:MAG: ABC transporter permease [Clostridiales bacterium]|nr:ABC transporter permease [Clostridiales bacterium]